jgi:FKBP-type peptidyl-prolyl cis-trans isomerase
MSKGEWAQVETEPEWAYGKQAQPDVRIPPNAKLISEVELVGIG